MHLLCKHGQSVLGRGRIIFSSYLSSTYSTQFTPIECLWKWLKNAVRANVFHQAQHDIQHLITRFGDYISEHLKRFYNALGIAWGKCYLSKSDIKKKPWKSFDSFKALNHLLFYFVFTASLNCSTTLFSHWIGVTPRAGKYTPSAQCCMYSFFSSSEYSLLMNSVKNAIADSRYSLLSSVNNSCNASSGESMSWWNVPTKKSAIPQKLMMIHWFSPYIDVSPLFSWMACWNNPTFFVFF